jgi:general secretion pathway protein M
MSLSTTFQAFQPLRARWNQLAGREKNLLKLALALVAVALLWFLLLAPALRTLRTADAQARELDAQLQHMLAMQAQAQALQKQPAIGPDDALRALKLATTQTLGATAQLTAAGESVSINLQGASADALAQWLAQARLNARTVPVEARLLRAASGTGVGWNGVLVMRLPARP